MMFSKIVLIRLLCSWVAAGMIMISTGGLGRCEDAGAPTEPIPSLAEVVYRAGSLAQRLDALKSRIDAVDGLRKVDHRLVQAKTRLNRFQESLKSINADDLQSYQQLAALKAEIHDEANRVQDAVTAFTQAIQQVELWRQDWMAEKQRWKTWRSTLKADPDLQSVSEALDRAGSDINQALNLISRKLEPMLAVQQKAGEIQAKISGMTNRIDTMMAQRRGGTLRGGTPTIFSVRYLRQLIDLTHEPDKIINMLSLPEPAFFSENGWVIGFQVVLFIVLFALIRNHRSQLLEHPQRRFLGRRQIAVPLLVSIFTFAFLYGTQPAMWRMLIQTLAGVATARLVAAFVGEPWVKRSIYILVLVMISFQALLALGIPLALMRLFILIWTVAGLIYFGWRARKAASIDAPLWQAWLYRVVILMFALITVADVLGFSGLAVQLMDSAIRTVVLLLMGWAMIRLSRVALEISIELQSIGHFSMLRNNAHLILSRLIVAVNFLISAFVVANLLVAWKLYAIPAEALHDFFGFGLTIGGHTITIGLVLVALLILYGSFAFSWGLQRLLMENILNRGQMDTGARLSIVRLVHYALVLVGFLIALSAMGFELKNITIIGGALGVGIGFGMQAIVNNFVSGLILLFERPIKVGDVIQLSDGQQGRVTNLGLRATTVQTFDRAEIVVPNGDLITNQVTNWTLEDRSMRLIIPVGVAYGSDVETVMRVLMAVATENSRVLKDPQPMVLFLNFGDSSLDFQLRVWIADFNERRIIQSDLIREIDRRFRNEGVEIPFPQRDLHLRSMEEKVAERLHKEAAPARP